MKSGVTLQQMLTEVKRQSESKEDYLIAPNRLRMESYGKEMFLHLSDDSGTELIEPMTITGIAHRQIGTHLRIPAAYYDRMREERPDLLAYNANTWFKQENSQRMLRTLDGSARAYLSNRYRRIDNLDIARVVLPIIGEMEGARFESCGQKWMDLSEGHYGVSMLNDCKYGHSVKDSVIGLTLIKSGIEPNPTTDQEVHHFTYAIYPHAEKWQAAGTVPQAFFLNQPALAVQGGKPGESFSLAGLDAPNVVLETIKRAEDGDGAIVRMYECENSLTNVTLDWNLPFHAAESCNCLEQPDGEPVEVKDGKITFTVKPYEIKTIRIR